MVFITAGMGGGTGTGAAPIVAQIAKSLDILTVAVVTKPLKIEGRHRMESAERGIQELRRHVDSLIEIPNQRLLGQSEGMNVQQTFAFANKVLIDAVRGITEIINNNGVINVDFADVKTIMSNQGSPSALMGTGIGRGEKRALSAAAAAISSPLLNHDISGASAVLLNFTGSTNMSLDEIHDAAETITQKIAGDPQVILGMVVDETGAFDEECMKVTVIATGFPEMIGEDYFDSQPVKASSPYGHRGHRPSIPIRQRSEQSAPPRRSYQSPSVSTNPPIVNDSSSSSSSDEHPQWRAEAPNIINEVPIQQSAHDPINGSFSQPSGLYGQSPRDQAQGNPSHYDRHQRDHLAPQAEPSPGRRGSASRASSLLESSGQVSNAVSYPERTSSYNGHHSREGRSHDSHSSASYGGQPSSSAPRRESSRGSYSRRQQYGAPSEPNQGQAPNAERAYPSPPQQERPTQRESSSSAQKSTPTPRGPSGRRGRGRSSLSSLMPVAPIDSDEANWGAQQAPRQESPSPRDHYQQADDRRGTPESSSTQNYDSVGYSPNGLPVYRG